MDELKKDDIIQYITVDPSSAASKYKYQYGFVNSVGPTNYSGKVLYSIKFIDGKIVYGIPEDCIRKADVYEAALFRRKYVTKHDHNLLDSVTLTAGKLYSNGKFVADVKDGNNVNQIFFDEFVTEDKNEKEKENKNMLGIGDKVKTNCGIWVIPRGIIGTVIDINEYACTVLFDMPVHSFDGEIKTYKFRHCELSLVRKYGDPYVPYNQIKKKDTVFIFGHLIIEKVIFSGNRTVVLWSDGDKTIVKANCEAFDREKGLAMAIAKKFLGTNASKSNYYDIFKKWIPEELIEQHTLESEPKDFPMNPPEEEERPWDSSMRHQVSDEIVDKIMAGADTEDLKKSIEKSKKILDAEKKGVRPSISGYFPSEPSERGPIQNFVERFKPGYFPAEFIAFCKKHNLGFIVDGKVVSPYEVKWQNVAGFLRRGVIAMRKKINPNDGHEYMAVDMENMLFQRLPRNTKDKEEVKND